METLSLYLIRSLSGKVKSASVAMLSVRSHLLREDVREDIVQVPVELEPLLFERLHREDGCFF